MKFDNNKKLNVKDLVRGRIYKRIIRNYVNEDDLVTFFKYNSHDDCLIYTHSQLTSDNLYFGGRIILSLGNIYNATKKEVDKYYEKEMDYLIF